LIAGLSYGDHTAARAQQLPALISDRLASGNLGRKATELFTLVGAQLRAHDPAVFDVCIDQTCGEQLALLTGA
jgi:hypothetical protein